MRFTTFLTIAVAAATASAAVIAERSVEADVQLKALDKRYTCQTGGVAFCNLHCIAEGHLFGAVCRK
jgi:hypothetical protein